MTTAKQPKLSAVTRAAFSDVPYILDSIWRRMEFEAYRIGRINLIAPHKFTNEHAVPWPFFGAYLVIASFIVFGPTFTTLCNSFGWVGTVISRLGLGLLVLYLTVEMGLFVVVEICTRLAHRAEQQQKPRPRSPQERAAAQLLAHARAWGRTAELFRGWRSRRWDAIRNLTANLRTVRSALRAATPAMRARLIAAFVLLLFGLGFVILPFALAGFDMVRSAFDSAVCSPVSHGAAPFFQGLLQVLVFAALAYWGFLLWQHSQPAAARVQLLWMTTAWIGAAILMLLLAGDGVREATGGPYPQTYTVLLAFLMVIVFAAQWLARLVCAGLDAQTPTELRRALSTTQLFEDRRREPELSRLRILSAIVNGVVYHPLHLLLLPSLAALVAPTRTFVVWFGAAALMAMMLLAYGSVSRRWEELISIVRRWFLRGTPLFVSVAVITLAILRLLDVQYVSTVMDAAPVGIITMLIVGAYATLWFFEYWINRWIAEELLAILGAAQRGQVGYVDYLFPGSPPGPSRVLARHRVLALQGPGELCVQGCLYRPNPRPGEEGFDFAFNIYTLTGLINRLAPGSRAANDLTRRIKTYFAIINVTLLLLAVGVIYAHRWSDQPLNAYPVVEADETAAPDAAHAADLTSLLERQARRHRPALILAASGGGTRAALYTATALEGLAQLGRTADIVLLSGVSGGGVAVAYLAGAYDDLQRPDDPAGCRAADSCPWARFKQLMTQPFIQDVLDGVDEWRIASTVPLGQLLAESLQRRVFTPGATIGGLHAPGLILNTTITGHPSMDSEILRGHLSIRDARDAAQPFASLAGSRLIFTNLANVDGFPRPPWPMSDIGLEYKVIRDPTVPLATAAALNANFPPVFSNARVCVGPRIGRDCKGDSYYVTDGGATENLGLVSALYELRGVLAAWPKASPGTAGGPPALPPQIDVIAIEASAITYDYTDDRGVGAATGGSKERINNGLTAELLLSINQQLTSRGAPQLRVHYLPLPTAFRSRGGFGTHWMYADEIRVSNPLLARPGSRFEQFMRRIRQTSYVYLSRGEVNALWSSLFHPAADFCTPRKSDSSHMRTVAEWICGTSDAGSIKLESPDPLVDAWRQLVSELGDPSQPPNAHPPRAPSLREQHQRNGYEQADERAGGEVARIMMSRQQSAERDQRSDQERCGPPDRDCSNDRHRDRSEGHAVSARKGVAVEDSGHGFDVRVALEGAQPLGPAFYEGVDHVRTGRRGRGGRDHASGGQPHSGN